MQSQTDSVALDCSSTLTTTRPSSTSGSKRQFVVFRRGSKKILSQIAVRRLKQCFERHSAHERGEEDHQYQTLEFIGTRFGLGLVATHKLYIEWKEDPTFSNRLRVDPSNRGCCETKLQEQRLQHLKRLLRSNPFLTQGEMTAELNKIEELKGRPERGDKEITVYLVGQLLRRANFRKKRVRFVPKERNTTKSLEIRSLYCLRYKEITHGSIEEKSQSQFTREQAKIFFLDESGFNVYMRREMAWARPKEEVTVNCPINRGNRFSLLAAIGIDGLAFWRVIDGSFRRFQFLEAVTEFFVRAGKKSESPQYLILDNCSIHDREVTERLGSNHNFKVLFLPPYSPQLNPIEQWFHEIKVKVRKTNYTGEAQLLQVMERVLRSYEDHDFTAYYVNTMKFIQKGILKQRF